MGKLYLDYTKLIHDYRQLNLQMVQELTGQSGNQILAYVILTGALGDYKK
jgi:hypothetical protein